jgi:hypothetical protein
LPEQRRQAGAWAGQDERIVPAFDGRPSGLDLRQRMLVAAHGVEDDARHADLPDAESALMVDSDVTAAIIPRSAID